MSALCDDHQILHRLYNRKCQTRCSEDRDEFHCMVDKRFCVLCMWGARECWWGIVICEGEGRMKDKGASDKEASWDLYSRTLD